MILSYKYLNNIIEFEVVYRKRKTMCIKIEENGDIKVSVPLNSKSEEILSAIKPNSTWIIKKREEVTDRFKEKVTIGIKNGSKFIFLGSEYSLKVLINEHIEEPIIELYDNELIVRTPFLDENSIKKSMEIWYRKQTLQLVIDSIHRYQKYFNVVPTSIKVKEQKRRWASCTYKRGLLFNWRISMAPSNVIDYIVVHEMCHMIHMNHSKEYWNEVERVMPNYETEKEWLKKEGFRMSI